MRGGTVGAVVGLSLVLVLSAAAAPVPMRLEYRRSAGVASICPDERDFRNLTAVVGDGRDHFREGAPTVLRVGFDRVGGRYRVTVAVVRADGSLRGEPEVYTRAECMSAALEAAGTAFALLGLDGDAPSQRARGAGPAEHPGSAASAWVPPPLPPERLQPVPVRGREMDVTIGLSAMVLMSAGLNAEVAPGFGVMADVRGEWLSLGLELRGMLPSRTVAAEPIPGLEPTTGPLVFETSQWTALLVPCVRWAYFVGCGVAQGGLLHVQTPVEQGTFAQIAFGPRLGVEVPFAGRFAVFAIGEALIYALGAQIRFDIAGDGVPPPNRRWSQSIASGFFGAGMSVKLE